MKFNYQPPAGLPQICYEDDQLLAVNKPSGLLSNPGIAPETHDCALSRLQARYKDLWLVHRLDCDTSGLLLLAKTKQAERALKIQLQNRQISKCYEALAQGQINEEQGEINEPLAPQPNNPPFQQVSPEGKAALTRWQVLSRTVGHTRLALFPATGRTHQLRVHLAWLGHPLLGDTFYGDPNSFNRLCLHARQLSFTHPSHPEQVEITCPCPF